MAGNFEDLKLALSMIVEEHEPPEIVRRAITSVSPVVQAAFVTVTYKGEEPKNTPLLTMLKELGVNITTWKWTGRFDEARNFARQHIPADFPYYIWLDADDVLMNVEAIPGILREAFLYNYSAVFFDYWYMVEVDEKGNVKEVLVKHKRERIIRNNDIFKWVGRLHETLIEQRQYNVIKIFKKEAIVVHLTTADRTELNLNRNIEILEDAIEIEKRKDPRTIMYLAKAYYDRFRFEKEEDLKKIDLDLCEGLFIEYLEGSGKPGIDYKGGSGWEEERASAWEYLSDIFRLRGQINRAIRANLNALSECPFFPNYYLDMAMNYVMMKNWKKADHWLEIGKHVQIPETTMIVTPRDLKARAMEIDFHVANGINDLDRAQKAAKRLTDLFPTNQDMKNRLAEAETKTVMNKAAQSIVYLGKFLEQTNQKEKLASLVESVPREIEQEQFASEMRNRFSPSRLWDKDEIAIFCGPMVEKWSPKSLESGIGGSEAAVIYQARELAKLGYRVTVYGDPREDYGEYDGVKYVQWHKINVKDTFNILILWRAIGVVDGGLSARQTYLWMHDVPPNNEFLPERLKKIKKIFVLSEYHKSLFMMPGPDGKMISIPDEKFFITANGTMRVPLDPKIERDPHRLIYTSSYDRGLVHLLNIWPDVKKEIPDANLHIFYGWQTFDALFPDNPERKFWKANVAKMMKQDGITEHGRVGHKELAEEYEKSGIFSYPCDFQEISCQNAMSAQIYGAIPVVTNYAALKETVQWGKKVDVDVTSEEERKQYAQALVAAMKDTDWQKDERKKMMKWAEDKFRWEDVAKKWKEEFNSTKGLVSLLGGDEN